MGEVIRKNPYWIALLGITVTLLLAILTSANAYGGLSKQVDVNKENIGWVQNDLKGYPTRSEFATMQTDIREIKNYLMGEKQ